MQKARGKEVCNSRRIVAKVANIGFAKFAKKFVRIRE